MTRKANPCSKHKLAFPSWKYVELIAMEHDGYIFNRCKVCGWIIRVKEV